MILLYPGYCVPGVQTLSHPLSDEWSLSGIDTISKAPTTKNAPESYCYTDNSKTQTHSVGARRMECIKNNSSHPDLAHL